MMLIRTTEWLEEVGLLESSDPNVMRLLHASGELEALPKMELSDKERLNASRSLMHSIGQARKALEDTLGKADSKRSLERFARIYGGIAAESLGWVDLGLLTPQLQQLVLGELAEQGIEIKDYDPMEVAI